MYALVPFNSRSGRILLAGCFHGGQLCLPEESEPEAIYKEIMTSYDFG